MKYIVFTVYVLFYLCNASEAGPETKISLNEFIDATLSSKFDDNFFGEEKEATALAILEYCTKETNIDPEYLTNVFYEVLEVESKEELEGIKYKLEKAVDIMNLVIKHFQGAPNDAGRRPSEKTKEEKQKDEL
uniref:uncharacterized protein LOC120342493 n=1 Tax=Styela clava TaxID=7725 RepID=UPI001939A586|nr:uncharacterized protein LOC120342493 [Styela clava]